MSIKLDNIQIVVQQIDRSISFYRALGLDIPDPDGGPYHEARLEGGVRVSWNEESMMRDIYPEWKARLGQRVALAFLCESPSDVDSRYWALVESGYAGEKEPWDAFWGHRYAQIADPDGNVVDIFAPLG